METSPADSSKSTPTESALWWGFGNLGRFTLILALVYVGVALQAWRSSQLGDHSFSFYLYEAYGAFLLNGVVFLPGTLLFLVAVYHLPRSWPALNRRLVALGLTPLIGFWLYLMTFPRCILCANTLFFTVAVPLFLGLALRLPR